MGELSKQITIYLSLLLVFSTFTIVTPFYPKIAMDKGLPFWLIGIIFALNPLANLLISPIIGKYMNKIGRKNIVLFSFICTSASMIFLSPIEYCEKNTVIALSVLSRISGGAGGGSLLNSVTTIFASDYPEKMQIMLGRMEASIGIGLILGPLIGTALYQINLLAAFLFMGIAALLFTPAASKLLGTFRPYEINHSSLTAKSLIIKPVIHNQRIFLSMLMNTAFLFSFGLVDTILEIHLFSFGLNRNMISLCFILQSIMYLTVSLTAGYILKKLDERIIMTIGVCFLGLAYAMLGPWTLIFPNNAYIVVASLPLMAIGESLTYSKCYSVFSIPYMLKSAENDFEIPNDDILSDKISSVAVIAGAVGEILGPLYAGFFSGEFGIEFCCTIASLASFLFAGIYIIGSGYLFSRNTHSRTAVHVEYF